MSKGVKQRNEAKRILKQKLFDYQNEMKNQSDIVIYDAYLTAGSEKFGLPNSFKRNIKISKSKINNPNINDYDQYLNCIVQHDDLVVGKKSLTRQNILAINKKGKAIKFNLNQMAKKRNSIQTTFVPYSSLENSSNITPQHLQQSVWPQNIQWEQGTLSSLLTIQKSKKQQIQRPFDYIRKSMSQQSTRKKKTFSTNSKPSTAHIRAKSQIKIYTIQNPQREKSQQLTQYYTPCYHKQTGSGYIVNGFQPRIRAKHFEDNLKVMSKMIKKKISHLERNEIVNYLKRISERKDQNMQDGKVQQLVRKHNWMSQRNILQSKMVKAKKIDQLKQNINASSYRKA